MRAGLLAGFLLPVALTSGIMGFSHEEIIIRKLVGVFAGLYFVMLIIFIAFIQGKVIKINNQIRSSQNNYKKLAEHVGLSVISEVDMNNKRNYLVDVINFENQEEESSKEYMVGVILITTAVISSCIFFTYLGLDAAWNGSPPDEVPLSDKEPLLNAFKMTWPISISLGFGLGVYSLFGTIFIYALLNKIRRIQKNIRTLEYQRDISGTNVQRSEVRAEILLQRNEDEIARYYRINTSQNRTSFLMGIIFVLIGVSIIIITMYFISNNDGKENSVENAIIGTIGGIISTLSNIIGGVLLRIYSRTTDALNKFHERLLAIHELMLANFLTSRITDKAMREETFSKISIDIIGRSRFAPNSGENSEFQKKAN
jgi:uncharacterized membrane protein